MYRYIILSLFLLFCHVSFAQHRLPKPAPHAAIIRYDSTKVMVRKLDPHKLRAYTKERDFQYREEASVNMSFWERLMRAIWKVLNILLQNKYTGPVGKYAMIAVIAGAVIFLLIRFSGLNLSILTGKSKPAEIPYTTDTENIHEINFSEDIAAAVNVANYRLAVRLLYLSALKRLSDKKLIDWRPEKTNHTYIGEISDPGNRAFFAVLTSQFEYIWYGEFLPGYGEV